MNYMEISNKIWSISQTGSALVGAGLIKLDDLYIGLLLIGVGVALQILVAMLNKFNIPVSNPPIG